MVTAEQEPQRKLYRALDPCIGCDGIEECDIYLNAGFPIFCPKSQAYQMVGSLRQGENPISALRTLIDNASCETAVVVGSEDGNSHKPGRNEIGLLVINALKIAEEMQQQL